MVFQALRTRFPLRNSAGMTELGLLQEPIGIEEKINLFLIYQRGIGDRKRKGAVMHCPMICFAAAASRNWWAQPTLMAPHSGIQESPAS
jgi:hypothetical protein